MLNDMLETLREIAGDDTDFILDLLESYRDTTPDLLAQIETACRGGDPGAMGRAAHSLKSSTAMIGCLDFSTRCAALERACKSGETDPAALAPLADAVLTGYAEVEEAIADLDRRLRTPHAAAPPLPRGFGLNA